MVKVFYSDISFLSENVNIDEFSLERKAYVNSIKSSQRKKQSIYAWKLLLTALKKLEISTTSDFSCDNGKWELVDKSYCFSISHSINIVVVAVSDQSVGVDIEMLSKKLLRVCKNKFSHVQEIDYKSELLFYSRLWTEYECKIKNASSNQIFSYSEVFDSLGNQYTIGLIANQKICLEKINIG